MEGSNCFTYITCIKYSLIRYVYPSIYYLYNLLIVGRGLFATISNILLFDDNRRVWKTANAGQYRPTVCTNFFYLLCPRINYWYSTYAYLELKWDFHIGMNNRYRLDFSETERFCFIRPTYAAFIFISRWIMRKPKHRNNN